MLRRKLRWFCHPVLELSKQCPNIQGNLETFERSSGAQTQLRILGTWIGVTSLAGVDRQREEGGCTACGIYPEHSYLDTFSQLFSTVRLAALRVASIGNTWTHSLDFSPLWHCVWHPSRQSWYRPFKLSGIQCRESIEPRRYITHSTGGNPLT